MKVFCVFGFELNFKLYLPALFGFLKLDQRQLVDQCGISLNPLLNI